MNGRLDHWGAELTLEFGRLDALWQLVLLLLALLAGTVMVRRFRRRFAVPAEQTPGWSLARAAAGFDRVLFPLVVLVLLLIGRAALAPMMSTRLLDIAVPLLFSWAAICLLLYLLRTAFPDRVLPGVERALSLAIWGLVALYVTGLLPFVQSWLEHLVIPIGKTRVSVFDALAGCVSVAVTLLVALWLGTVLENWLDRASHIDRSLAVVFTRLGRALLLFLALMIGLSLVGFDLTLLSVFGGALGVGLGLGLQKIASNYVSGFIILLDHSLRLGDTVSIDKYTGVVTQIRTRYTLLRNADGSEAIVPNEMAIAQVVQNRTRLDKKAALQSQLRIAYASDVDRALALMIEAAKQQPRALETPPPQAYLTEFAHEGFVLTVEFTVANPDDGKSNVISDVNLAIWRRFTAEGITFATAPATIEGPSQKT
ncbi:mechanosensitive ion channel [soil metagenome]